MIAEVMTFRILEIPTAVYQAMLDQAREERPNECCGLLAGVIEGEVGRVTHRYPLVNELHSPVAYVAEGRGSVRAHVHARENGIEILATYHSHPTSPPVPSRRDLADRYGDGVACAIISLTGESPSVRVWWLSDTAPQEAEWRVS